MYCRQCGNPLGSGDRFCGSCGVEVTSVSTENAQVIPRSSSAQSTPARTKRASPTVGVLAVLLVLLVGGGIFTLYGSDSGIGGFAGSGSANSDEPAAPANPGGSAESSSPETADPADSSDPAFDLILPILSDATAAPVMLPAELPTAFENMGLNENMLEEDRYGLTFLTTPPDELVGGWARAETIGSLEAVPESEYEPDSGFEPTSTESVTLPDGTEAELSYMEPAVEGAMYGPQWEGTFTRDGYTYSLKLQDYGKEKVEQALSTMVEVE